MHVAQRFLRFSSVFIALALLLVNSWNIAAAQVSGPASSLSGWFSIVWGDSKDGKSSMTYTLTDANGQQTLLQVDKTVAKKLGGVLQFNGKYVSVQGALNAPLHNDTPSGSTQRSPAVLQVFSISLAPSSKLKTPKLIAEAVVTPLALVSGSKPWVTIMCKFSDIAAEPEDRAFFVGMYGDTEPGLNHYWKELSFNTADVTGSTVGTDWYTLPQTELHYNPTDTEKGTDRTALANDCIAAADADIDFSLYSGINMMFNSDVDNGWAWGGGWNDTLDGVTKTWSITWEPPWAYADISVIAHEMGHGFGLPHSTAIDRDPDHVYDHAWDVMSQDRYNCAAATDPTYGCMAQHTISYHKDLLGWIPGPQKITVAVGASATVSLEDLAAPASTNYQMVNIPIGGSATNYYTVEARRFTGYDAKLPDEAVIIHDVDTTEGIPALLAPGGLSATDPDVWWTPGETFIDATNKIAVIVNSDTGSGFEVTVSNGNLPPTSDAGGPYTEECAGATTAVTLDGSGSSDPEGLPLSYAWSTTCDGVFNDSTLAQPILTVNTANVCMHSCSVTLTVTDAEGLSGVSDSAIVTIRDTTPPALANVPGDETVECDAVPLPALVTASDICDPTVTPDFSEIRADGTCADNYTLTRTWTGTDDCGHSSSAAQTVTVQDTKGPVISCNSPATIKPPDAPISFTATATDNCADDPPLEIIGYDCFKFTKKGKRIGKKESCIVELNGDTITIVDSGGVNDNITWTVRTNDNCGNTAESTCSVLVVRPGKL